MAGPLAASRRAQDASVAAPAAKMTSESARQAAGREALVSLVGDHE
jgi:hypothetical protein